MATVIAAALAVRIAGPGDDRECGIIARSRGMIIGEDGEAVAEMRAEHQEQEHRPGKRISAERNRRGDTNGAS